MFYSNALFQFTGTLATNWSVARGELDALTKNKFMDWPEQAPKYRDRIAAYFRILDVGAGTYHLAQGSEYPSAGVADVAFAAHPLRDCLYPRRG
jgi:hypothetical protein